MNTIRKASESFVAWCADGSPAARLERTIAQGVIGGAIGALSEMAGAPEWVQMGVAPIIMAVLAPLQAQLGESIEKSAR